MPRPTDSNKWLYYQLQKRGYNVGSEAQFMRGMNTDAGKQWAYDEAQKCGLNVGDYEGFSRRMTAGSAEYLRGVKPPRVKTPAATAGHGPAAPSGNPAATAGQGPTAPSGGVATPFSPGYTKDGTRLVGGLPFLLPSAGFGDALNDQAKDQREAVSSGAMLSRNVREGKPEFDSTTGRLERTFVTPDGMKTRSRGQAEQHASSLRYGMDEARKMRTALRDATSEVYDRYADKYGVGFGRSSIPAPETVLMKLVQARGMDYDKMAKEIERKLPKDYVYMLRNSFSEDYKKHPEHYKGVKFMDAFRSYMSSVVSSELYDYAKAKKAPKSTLEYIVRKIVDQPLLNGDLAASVMSGSHGESLTNDVAMEDYGEKHKVASIVGTIGNMASDPITYVSFGLGGFAAKTALKGVAKWGLKNVTTQVGARLLERSLKGRVLSGIVGGAVNFGFYQGAKTAESGLKNGTFSAADVMHSTLEGAMLGGGTGVMGPLFGNVVDKVTRGVSSTTGKVATRAAGVLTSTALEGTIFSVPEWIRGDKNAMDVWTDNLAMMAGFKIFGGMKSAPRVLEALKKDGRRVGISFGERVRNLMDVSPRDFEFTRSDYEELEAGGYEGIAKVMSLSMSRKDRAKGVRSMTGDPKDTGLSTEETRKTVDDVDFYGYDEAKRLVEDKKISAALRAKVYYAITGRTLPPPTIMYSEHYEKDGRYVVDTYDGEGGLVTRKTFTHKSAAENESQAAGHQAELNAVALGEHYREAQIDAIKDALLKDVCAQAAEDFRSRGESITAEEAYAACMEYLHGDRKKKKKPIVEKVEEIGESKNNELDEAVKKYGPAAIRETIKEETGIDVDAVLTKRFGKRTDKEQEVASAYLRELVGADNIFFPHEKKEEPFIAEDEGAGPAGGGEGPVGPAGGGEGPVGPAGGGEGPVGPAGGGGEMPRPNIVKGDPMAGIGPLDGEEEILYGLNERIDVDGDNGSRLSAKGPAVGTADEARRKYEAGLRVYGDEDEFYVDDLTLKGRFVVVEAGSTTASHDPNNFTPNPDFPVTDGGMSANTRDYENDKNAQAEVWRIANEFNGKAVQDFPIVTSDGVVLSGNNRTMSGDRAAANGTDGAYLETLARRARRFGIDASDLEGFKHPRIVFELAASDAINYSPKTFHLFNKSTMKAEDRTGRRIRICKTTRGSELDPIVLAMMGFDTLGDLYKSKKTTDRLIDKCVEIGLIGSNEIPAYREKDGSLTDEGKKLLQDVALGRLFAGREDVLLLLSKMQKADSGDGFNPTDADKAVAQLIRSAASILKICEFKTVDSDGIPYNIKDDIVSAILLYGEAMAYRRGRIEDGKRLASETGKTVKPPKKGTAVREYVTSSPSDAFRGRPGERYGLCSYVVAQCLEDGSGADLVAFLKKYAKDDFARGLYQNSTLGMASTKYELVHTIGSSIGADVSAYPSTDQSGLNKSVLAGVVKVGRQIIGKGCFDYDDFFAWFTLKYGDKIRRYIAPAYNELRKTMDDAALRFGMTSEKLVGDYGAGRNVAENHFEGFDAGKKLDELRERYAREKDRLPVDGDDGKPSAPVAGEDGKPSAPVAGEEGKPAAPVAVDDGKPSAPAAVEDGKPSAPAAPATLTRPDKSAPIEQHEAYAAQRFGKDSKKYKAYLAAIEEFSSANSQLSAKGSLDEAIKKVKSGVKGAELDVALTVVSDGIRSFASAGGYTVEVVNTREEMLDVAKDSPSFADAIRDCYKNGYRVTGFYHLGRIVVCAYDAALDINGDHAQYLNGLLTHESVHMDNANDDKAVRFIAASIYSGAGITREDALDIIHKVSLTRAYDSQSAIEIADELLAHGVEWLLRNPGKDLSELTSNKFVKDQINEAYERREEIRNNTVRQSQPPDNNGGREHLFSVRGEQEEWDGRLRGFLGGGEGNRASSREGGGGLARSARDPFDRLPGRLEPLDEAAVLRNPLRQHVQPATASIFAEIDRRNSLRHGGDVVSRRAEFEKFGRALMSAKGPNQKLVNALSDFFEDDIESGEISTFEEFLRAAVDEFGDEAREYSKDVYNHLAMVVSDEAMDRMTDLRTVKRFDVNMDLSLPVEDVPETPASPPASPPASQLPVKTSESAEVDLDAEKVPYKVSFDLDGKHAIGSVAPAGAARAMEESLARVEAAEGKDIVTFVCDELGYTPEELMSDFAAGKSTGLASEQVAGVALAIHAMKQGRGFICGDMTGVGKGRQAAALIRWGHRRGKRVLFVTEKADLLSAMYRDLTNIGSGDINPFCVNDGKEAEITDEDGNTAVAQLSREEKKKLYSSGSLTLPNVNGNPSARYGVVMMTYSQGNSLARGESETAKARQRKLDWIMDYATDAVVILDEAHNASGAGSNQGVFFRDLVNRSSCVTYLSATYAKRPDNMGLYVLRSSMNEANISAEDLASAVSRGGVPLQEFIAHGLFQNGEMVRRERDMTGIQTNWVKPDEVYTSEEMSTLRGHADSVMSAANAVVRFQTSAVAPIVAGLNAKVQKQNAAAKAKGLPTTHYVNTSYASQFSNLTELMALNLKVRKIGEFALERIRRGEKPVIVIDNTMEGYLDDFNGEDAGIAPVLDHAIPFATRVTKLTKDAGGNVINREDIDLRTVQMKNREQFDAMLKLAEDAVDQTVAELSGAGITMSPIDAIKRILTDAGYKCGEITGRSRSLQKGADGKYFLQPEQFKAKKKDTMRRFNGGSVGNPVAEEERYDAVILNTSGTTGIDLHASLNFGDQRQRTMILSQLFRNTAQYLQVIGRIDRTFQALRGQYFYLPSPLPVEQKLLASLRKKIASLDANTTGSSRVTSNSIDVTDLVNVVGDDVANAYVSANPELCTRLGLSTDGGRFNSSDPMYTLLKGLLKLDCNSQESIISDLETAFVDELDFRIQNGGNPLVTTATPLDAVQVDAGVVVPGTAPDSPNIFAHDTRIERLDVKRLRKPLTSHDVLTAGVKLGCLNQDGTSSSTYRGEIEASISEKHTELVEAAKRARDEKIKEAEESTPVGKLQAKVNRIDALYNSRRQSLDNAVSSALYALSHFEPGRLYLVQSAEGSDTYSYGRFIGFNRGNGSAGALRAVFAVRDGRSRITIPVAGKIDLLEKSYKATSEDTISQLPRSEWDKTWDALLPSSDARETRYMVTGNVLQAFGVLHGISQNMQLFTRRDPQTGATTVDLGVLLPEGFDPDNFECVRKISFDELLEAGEMRNNDFSVSVTDGGGLEIVCPHGSDKLDRAYGDKKLKDLCDEHTKDRSSKDFTMRISPENARKAFDLLTEKYSMGVGTLFDMPCSGGRVDDYVPDGRQYGDITEDLGKKYGVKNEYDADRLVRKLMGRLRRVGDDPKLREQIRDAVRLRRAYTVYNARYVSPYSSHTVFVYKSLCDNIRMATEASKGDDRRSALAFSSALYEELCSRSSHEYGGKDPKLPDLSRAAFFRYMEANFGRVRDAIESTAVELYRYSHGDTREELNRVGSQALGREPKYENTIQDRTDIVAFMLPHLASLPAGDPLIGAFKRAYNGSRGYFATREDALSCLHGYLDAAEARKNGLAEENPRLSVKGGRPPRQTRKGYAVYVAVKDADGRYGFFPKMVNEGVSSVPMLTWMNADTGTVRVDKDGNPVTNSRGRVSVDANSYDKDGGRSRSSLAWRPGKHLAPYPNATQFGLKGENSGTIPANLVFFEVEYAADRDYQTDAMEYGMTKDGRYDRTQAGLPYLPKDGYYMYRTNPKASVPPTIITGAYRLRRALTDAEAQKLCEASGGTWLPRHDGSVVDEAALDAMGVGKTTIAETAAITDLSAIEAPRDESDKVMRLEGYTPHALNFADERLRRDFAMNSAVGAPDMMDYAKGYESPEERGWTREDYTQAPRFSVKGAGDSVSVDGVDLPITARTKVLAAEAYDRRMKETSTQLDQAWRDNMTSLRILQEEIGRTSEADIPDFMDAYHAAINMSSINRAEIDLFRAGPWAGLMNALHALGGSKKQRYRQITQYMLAKHGLERNLVLARRDGRAMAEAKYGEERGKMSVQLRGVNLDISALMSKTDLTSAEKGRLTRLKAKADKLSMLMGSPSDFMAHLVDRYTAKCRERDYSGLTALYDVPADAVKDAEERAEKEVSAFEGENETDALWDAVRACTSATLETCKDAGLMSTETYEKVLHEFDTEEYGESHYIPLRGWEEATAEDVYGYMGSNDNPGVGNVLKTAKGRSSVADDPIATIGSMGEHGIAQANRNRLKQRMLSLAEARPSDALTVSRVWARKDETTGEWEILMPEIPDGSTPGEVSRIMEAFDDRCKELHEDDPTGWVNLSQSVRPDIKPRIVWARDRGQHIVMVKRNGRTYFVSVNGDPKAAQAINGLTAPEMDESIVQKVGGAIVRNMAALFTVRNPAFIMSNLFRDAGYANAIVWAKEDPRYAATFNRNWFTSIAALPKLILDYNAGKPARGRLAVLFDEFMRNGGETGYSNLLSVEDYKSKTGRDLKRLGYGGVRRAGANALDALSQFNRWAEDVSRFSAFVTSRELGRSAQQSATDAKEITVNFNRKGAGSRVAGRYEAGNRMQFISASTSQLARGLYVFWNAGVQGVSNFCGVAKRHPAKFMGLCLGLGALAVVSSVLSAGVNADDEEYWAIPEHERRSNFIFKLGGRFFKIPLAVEFRGIYGLSNMCVEYYYGRTDLRDLTGEDMTLRTMQQLTQLFPVDVLEGQRHEFSWKGVGLSLTPSAVRPLAEVAANESWTGLPIYKEDRYNPDMPGWAKTYARYDGTVAQKLCRELNGVLNDNKETHGGPIDLNPAVIDYLLNGYFGGPYAATRRVLGNVEAMVSPTRDYQARDLPILNRFVVGKDERQHEKSVRSAAYDIRSEMDGYKDYLDTYKKLCGEGKDPEYGRKYAKKYGLDYKEELKEWRAGLAELQKSEAARRYAVYKPFAKKIRNAKSEDERTEAEEGLVKAWGELKAGRRVEVESEDPFENWKP